MLESLFEHHNTLTQMIAYTSASLERNGFWDGKNIITQEKALSSPEVIAS